MSSIHSRYKPFICVVLPKPCDIPYLNLVKTYSNLSNEVTCIFATNECKVVIEIIYT